MQFLAVLFLAFTLLATTASAEHRPGHAIQPRAIQPQAPAITNPGAAQQAQPPDLRAEHPQANRAVVPQHLDPNGLLTCEQWAERYGLHRFRMDFALDCGDRQIPSESIK